HRRGVDLRLRDERRRAWSNAMQLRDAELPRYDHRLRLAEPRDPGQIRRQLLMVHPTPDRRDAEGVVICRSALGRLLINRLKVRFAVKATELLHRSDMTRCAKRRRRMACE